MLLSMMDKLGLGASFDNPTPDQPLFVIGDIHGGFELLRTLIEKAPAGYQAICVGDLVDRGAASRDVLAFLHDRPDIICLRGNHEHMMLRFLTDPSDRGKHWLRYGGRETLASFGIEVDGAPDDAALQTSSDRLRAALGDDLLAWLDGLPSSFLSGNVLIVHAGADPDVAPDNQDPDRCVWGHPAFHKRARRDGCWVVHGHNIVAEPEVDKGRIAIDTGAYATGILSGVCLDGKPPTFLSVSSYS